MYVFGIHGFILISATLRLSMIQDLQNLVNDLKKSAEKINNSNVIQNAIENMEDDIADLHEGICNVASTRSPRQALVGIIAGTVAAAVTLITTSGTLINWLNPHHPTLSILHQVPSPELQLKLEVDDRLHISNIQNHVSTLEEIVSQTKHVSQVKALMSSFLEPSLHTPIAKTIRTKAIDLYIKKFKTPPLTNLDYTQLTASHTHSMTPDPTKACSNTNLSISYEVIFPTIEAPFILSSPQTATDQEGKICLITSGTKRIRTDSVMLDYPYVQVQRIRSLCSEGTCHDIKTNPEPCLVPHQIYLQHGKIVLFASSVITINCRKSSTRKINATKGFTISPQPLCSYAFPINDLLLTIDPIPTYSKSILSTDDHLASSLVLHNSSLQWSTNPYDLKTNTIDVHPTTNSIFISLVTIGGLSLLVFVTCRYRNQCKGSRTTSNNTNDQAADCSHDHAERMALNFIVNKEINARNLHASSSSSLLSSSTHPTTTDTNVASTPFTYGQNQ